MRLLDGSFESVIQVEINGGLVIAERYLKMAAPRGGNCRYLLEASQPCREDLARQSLARNNHHGAQERKGDEHSSLHLVHRVASILTALLKARTNRGDGDAEVRGAGTSVAARAGPAGHGHAFGVSGVGGQ